MRKKVLSVSVAAYNIENYIDECLSPFDEDCFDDDLEVLIVDDGSMDETAKRAKEYMEKRPTVFRYIRKENGGWGSTVNTGVTEASGTYFKQLDGDDHFDREHTKDYIEYLKNVDTDIVFTDYRTYRSDTNEVVSETDYSHKLDQRKAYPYKDVKDISILPDAMHCVTVKTEILKEHYEEFKLTEKCFYTDVEYVIKAINLARDFAYCPEVVYMYRVGNAGQSVSLEGIRKHYGEHRKVLENGISYMQNHVRDEVKRKIIVNKLKTMAANQYQFYLCLDINRANKKQIKEFDNWLKTTCPEILPYGWKRYELLRKTHFMAYGIAANYVQKTIG